MTTQVPAARVQLIDSEGRATPAFFRFLQSFYVQAGGSSISVEDIETLLIAAQRPSPAPIPSAQDPMAALARQSPAQPASQADMMQNAMSVARLESAVQQMRARLEQVEAYVLAARVATQ